MSRFNSEAYDKLFPRKQEVETVETVTPTFTPTADKLEEKSVESVEVVVEKVVETTEDKEVDDNGHSDNIGRDNE